MAFEKETKYHERERQKRRDEVFGCRLELDEQRLKLDEEKFALDREERQEACSERVKLVELMGARVRKLQ